MKAQTHKAKGRRGLRGWHTRSKVFAGVLGAGFAAAGGFALASNWTVGLSGGSSGEGQSATVANLTIAATASPAANNLLFPGGNGDVVATITNSNPFAVQITAVQLPANTTYAAGYTTSALTSAQTGCGSGASLVSWNYATGSSGSSHSLTSALTVAANGTLTVTLTNDASMGAASPAACESTFFSMPSLTGVTASETTGSATSSPATDAWTS